MTQQTATASVKVDGDKLAEAIRRVTPFMADENPPNLACVYAESQGGTLQLTTTDGFRLAHLTVALPFPEGNFLMKGAGVKDFSTRHYNGQEVTVEVGPPAVQIRPQITPLYIKMGEVTVELENTPYINYPSAVPEDLDMEAIIDTKAWIKPIRQNKPLVVGIVYSSAGCRMFLQNAEGETVACESLPVQMFAGPDKKVAYHADQFRRALTSCGASATIEVGDPAKATLFEAEDYWHILSPRAGFPREVTLSNAEREGIKWAEEALQAVRKGEVPGLILIGGGKFYLELSPGLVATQILVREPMLAEAELTVPGPQAAVETNETSKGEE
ncbi:hypothetical protein ES703_18425 [subsurface metagenome]